MGFVLLYLGLCFIVASIGSNRKVGFWVTFIVSVFFSPLVGAIVLLFSSKIDKKDTVINTSNTSSADELLKYKKLLDDGAISQDEYERQKNKLLNK